jgi:hypothetical protein
VLLRLAHSVRPAYIVSAIGCVTGLASAIYALWMVKRIALRRL